MKLKPIHPRLILTLLTAITATLLLGSLASATGDATTSKIEEGSLHLQAQQPHPGSEPVVPVGSSFTYQGRLKDGPNPANGQYDFEFRLFDSLTGGAQVGAVIARLNLPVSEGLVTVNLDFGPIAFRGQSRYLEVAVRPTGGGGFTTLTPRQAVSPAPYAASLRPQAVITSSSASVEFAIGATGVEADSTGGTAIIGTSANSVGVRGESTTSTGVHGESISGVGVRGISENDYGVRGVSDVNTGVRGESTEGLGVSGISTISSGVKGAGVIGVEADGNFAGVFASGGTWAGYFEGNINVTGNCIGCVGPNKIDHPLDPANKYLVHSQVQSQEMMNIYNGNVTLDVKGEATVVLPDWFGALNKDYRYQLTAVGAPGPNLYISKKVENNRFSIAGGSQGMEVSWQVTGIRKDSYAQAHRIVVEEDKGKDRGKYLHPTEHGQPESKGIGYEERP